MGHIMGKAEDSHWVKNGMSKSQLGLLRQNFNALVWLLNYGVITDYLKKGQDKVVYIQLLFSNLLEILDNTVGQEKQKGMRIEKKQNCYFAQIRLYK